MSKYNVNRRQFLKIGGGAVAGFALTSKFGFTRVLADPAVPGLGLSDPSNQPKFTNLAPNALDPSFIYQPDNQGRYKIQIREAMHESGLEFPSGNKVLTPIWGYGDQNKNVKVFTWPGRTFQIKNIAAGGGPETEVFWANSLKNVTTHLLPVDTNLHWCYSLPGYEANTIAANGVPIITHLHGGHTDYQFDGNPEFFYSPNGPNQVIGPQWNFVPGGFTNKFMYDNNVPAGNLWYHDHALGITRLNVYAGLAGFYFVRDDQDTGEPGNSLNLPAFPFELAYAIQDRMFLETGELFYPAYPGDPYYDDFITGEGAILPPELFPGGGPTALAEFFGDHMVVNGIIWPYEEVEPRNYRMHLLNGTDSRFMILQFVAVPKGETDFTNAGDPIDFYVIGSDQGLASEATMTNTLLSEPGSRYDIVFDFKGLQGQRVIMKNIGGDEPFGGDPGPQIFSDTDKIMAFDVQDIPNIPDAFNPGAINVHVPSVIVPSRTRKVALFEGKDEFGRLQPLLGTAEPAVDYTNNPANTIDWPATPVYQQAVLPDGTQSPLTGPMEGSIAWHSPTTENPALDSTEEWEIWNMTGDAHPVHLHLVNFDILGREEIVWDSHTIEEGDELPDGGFATEDDETRVIPNDFYEEAAGDGTYLEVQPTVQHNSIAGDQTTYGMGFKIKGHTTTGVLLPQPDGYVENAPKDMVTALPGQVTRIKAQFDKLGRYVWHCHILSHEDHEMMRVLHVGPGA